MPVLAVAPATIAFDAEEGGEATISVSNAGTGTLLWSAAIVGSAGWLELGPFIGEGDGSVTLTAQPNEITEVREATIRVTSSNAENGPIDVVVSQEAAEPVLPEDLNGDAAINAVDVQLVINGALGLETGVETDVNNDGATNAVDVQLVINGALGL